MVGRPTVTLRGPSTRRRSSTPTGLVFFPFVTALVYLVVRGGGMAERSAKGADAMRAAQEGYIREVAGSAGPADQITQAKALLDTGTITQDEFSALKARALA